MNLKEIPVGMSLTEIKELCYTIHFQGTTKVTVESGWLYNLQSLAQNGAITIDNDIIKFNKEK